ncbi:MAG TPA: DUF1385 domain-containing protein [Lachnospiraceae bacterium]|nr:DUF1385 domain-containing protein [Lachnospiraceae bacterium]HPF29094.1 DUF1385 domain-containing protein [Lachnospiraceae bacterium]
MRKKRKSVYSGIGGQAVLEGVMMKNKEKYAVAVRKPDGKIEVQKKETGVSSASILRKIPFVRGVLNFVDSMVLGMQTLTFSASFYEEEEEETKADIMLKKIFKGKAEKVVMGFTVFVSIAIAVGLFMILPYVISELLSGVLLNDSLIAIIEGVVRIIIFLAYVLLISLMKDIKRLYQYHGAEHKCINCVEQGRPLTVKNVMRCSRLHRRCGTSFLLIVMCISIILFFFIRVDTVVLKIVLRILLIPVIAGISYEILRLAGRSDNIIVRIISAPGMWLQRITTKEPDPEMVEVAIASVEAVFDWESFENKHFKRRMVKKTKVTEDGTTVETGEETMEINVLELEEKLSEISKSEDEPKDDNI